MMQELSVMQLSELLKNDPPPCVLDVRESWEQDIARLDITLDIPMDQVPQRLDDIRDQMDGRDLIVMCHSGVRSGMITRFLTENGFDRVFNLTGGIQAWSQQVDSQIPTY